MKEGIALSFLARGVLDTSSLRKRLVSFQGVDPEDSEVSLGRASIVSTGGTGGTLVEEARVTGGTEVRALSEIGSETVADERSVEVTVETSAPRTEVTGAVMTGTVEVTVETAVPGTEVTGAVITGSVAKVDATAGLCGQLWYRWPVCSHLKHCWT